MTPILENAMLGSDLDCQGKDILNIRHLYPVPEGLLDESFLDFGHNLPVLDGSVTNDHVAATAKIAQSKLDLSGEVPGFWLSSTGHTPVTVAARGNLSEYVANKGAANGYAGLDSVGRLLPANVTPGAQPGTVNTVRVAVPPEMQLAGSDTITTSGTFDMQWGSVPDNSYLGVHGDDDFSGNPRPRFLADALPVGVVPDLSAIKFTSGTFALELLPRAVGMGLGHATGTVTDPGETGQATDYIGRDMKWHRFSGGKAYQPVLKKPTIVLASWTLDDAKVTIRTLVGSFLFYRVTAGTPAILPDFIRAPSDHVTLTLHNTNYVEAYAAKAGYNNSEISEYVVLTPFG